MQTSLYQAVLFDFDDTLVKTWVKKWAQHKYVAKKHYNVDITDETLATHWGMPFDHLLKAMYGEVDSVENMHKLYVACEAEFLKDIHEHSLPVLQQLLDAGLELGIVSSMTSDVVVADLERLNFPVQKLAVVQGSDGSMFHKPDPRVFDPALHILERKGVTDPSRIVYVGDALMDYLAARDAGFGFVGVTTGRDTADELRSVGATHIVESLADVPKTIL